MLSYISLSEYGRFVLFKYSIISGSHCFAVSFFFAGASFFAGAFVCAEAFFFAGGCFLTGSFLDVAFFATDLFSFDADPPSLDVVVVVFVDAFFFFTGVFFFAGGAYLSDLQAMSDISDI